MVAKLRSWIPLAIAITAICGLIYSTNQQTLRLGGNDPQSRVSEDIADLLSQGKDPSKLIPEEIDISRSLGTFVMTFDQSGKLVSSTGKLDGKDPVLPKGVLEYTRTNEQNKITWEPAEGIRQAAVVTHYRGNKEGFVLAARSLRLVERRENWVFIQVVLVWIVTMVATLLAQLILI